MSHPSDADLARFFDGALDPAAAAAVRDHMAECSQCAAALDRLQATLADPAPPDLAARLAALGAGLDTPPWYELGEVIGSDGMGVVRRARDTRLGCDVAAKLLGPDNPTGSAAATRFIREAQITGRLQHPGVPPSTRSA